eukprot:TRINITY_DN65594_c0_g1_i1.p1 TRINITY_DN65594_c0_g1~~TRINITY_DN65594_c0_g1_i1.p1  ORF type:complete len:864 (-),score=128.10 TRINITY_DN65594_c0_g1_i1:316-2907(-)
MFVQGLHDCCDFHLIAMASSASFETNGELLPSAQGSRAPKRTYIRQGTNATALSEDDSETPGFSASESLPTRRNEAALGRNSLFVKHMRFAVIGAIFVIVGALPAFAEQWQYWGNHNGRMRTFGDMTVPWGWPCLVTVFVMAPTLGTTIQNSWQAMTGAVFAVINNAILLPVIVSLWTTNRTFVLVTCFVDYAAFIVFNLAFDFGPKARLIALHFNTAWTMKLVQPSTTELWALDPDDSYNFPIAGFGCCMRTAFGCLCALLAVFLITDRPTIVVAEAATRTWKAAAADIFETAWLLTKRDHSTAEWERFFRACSVFPGQVAAAQSATNTAWWELCGDAMHRRHAALVSDQALGKQLVDCVESLSIQLRKAHFNPAEGSRLQAAAAVDAVLPPRLLELTREILTTPSEPVEDDLRRFPLVDEAAVDGEQKVVLLRAAGDMLKEKLATSKVETDTNPQPLLVLLTIEAYSKVVAETASKERRYHRQSFGFAGIRVTVTPGHFNFIMRNAVNIVTAFFIGVVGWNYDPNMATNIGWLTSKYLGSSVRKNQQRILGIVIPFVVGGCAYANYADCTILGKGILATILFWWSVVSLYVMAASSEFAYLALLCGAFAPIWLCKNCEDRGDNPHEVLAGVFTSIRGVVFGVGLMVVGDLLLKPRSACVIAANEILAIWSDLKDELQAAILHKIAPEPVLEQRRHTYFGTPVPMTASPITGLGSERLALLPGRIAAARRACSEAALHPYVAHAPFQTEVADEVLNVIQALRQEILTLRAIDEHLGQAHSLLAKQYADSLDKRVRNANSAMTMWLAPDGQKFAPLDVSTPAALSRSTIKTVPALTLAMVDLLQDIGERLADVEVLFVSRGII